ncbi:MAG: molybdenum ABC transporter ATP-binding protein [Cohaesibacteraceae bacterium]
MTNAAGLSVDLNHQLGAITLHVAFDVPPGTVTALFGQSGAGKTSILKVIAGLTTPDEGRVVSGEDVWTERPGDRLVPAHARGVGYVFQDARLFPHRSVTANLRYGDRNAKGRQPLVRFDDVVALLGLGDLLKRRPAGLSGGERQRVALGRALLSHPRVLLMDEPLAALDGARKAAILPLIERIRDSVAVPILYVSHDPQEVARLATNVLVLEDGKVLNEGPPLAVLGGPVADGPVTTLPGKVVGKNTVDGLFEISAAGTRLYAPAFQAALGDEVTLTIAARDVMLALTRPSGLSALNQLEVTVKDITPVDAARVDVVLSAGNAILLSRITRRSADQLILRPGQTVFAVIKSVALADGKSGHVQVMDV